MAAICEEFEDHQDSTGQPVILVGQSIVLGETKAETPVHDEDPRNDQIIWQQYTQQVESLSPENRLSKFCKGAGFMRVVVLEIKCIIHAVVNSLCGLRSCLSCGTCTTFVCSTDTLRISSHYG